MITVGIDPGITGAVVALEGETIVGIYDMPTTPKKRGKGLEINAYLLADMLHHINPTLAIVESVTSMPGQGVTGMFGFGRSLGVIEGVLAGLAVKTEFVRPQAWKKHFNLTKKPKDASRTLVIQRWPESSYDFRLKKHGGRADAALIALYGEQL